MQKIILIGPVYPYKGGISHYTGLMYRSLAKEYDVYMMSYKMQYPYFLFKKEQKDYDNDSFKIDNTDFCIHTANPLNWIHSANQIRKLKPDLVIFQWWHPYFAPCYISICKLLGKIPILFVCHNVFPHERFPMDRFLTKHVLSNGDFFIVHSKQDEADLNTIKKKAVYRRAVLPTYNIFNFQSMPMNIGRSLLGLRPDDNVLLFFGFVREYKGLKHLIHALPKVVEALGNVKLLIVGDFSEDKKSYLDLIDSLHMRPYIEIHDGYIPDKDIEKYFSASDVVVLPYESATQSAIVQIAFGFERPVIATNVGGLPEAVTHDKTGYIVEPKNSEQLSARIIQFFRENKFQEFQESIRQESYKFSWDRMRETITELLTTSFF
jgi:Glycosyltransferase